MNIVLWCFATWIESTGRASALEDAAQAELTRSMDRLALEGQPAPYFISYEVVDGAHCTASASLGVRTSMAAEPYRSARVDVRVGDYAFDNSNFSGTLGNSEGVVSRGLPTEDSAVALRRELWLATDQAYKGALEQFSSKRSAREGDPSERPTDLAKAPAAVREQVAVATPAPADVVEGWVTGLTALCRGRGLESCSAVARDWQGQRIVLNSEGTRVVSHTGFTVVRLEAVTRSDDGAKVRDLRSWVVRDPQHLPAFDAMKADATAMLDWLDAARRADVLDDYLGPVLFETGASVEMFSQLLLPEISGTPPEEEGRDAFSMPTDSPPTARLNRRLLPLGWSVVDDAAYAPDSPASYDYDFDGVVRQRVQLIVDGVVNDLLMSRIPRLDRLVSNGHGRSAGNDRRVALPSVVEVRAPHPWSWGRLVRRGLALARQTGHEQVLVIRSLEPVAMAEDFDVAFSGDAPLAGLTRPLEAYLLGADGVEHPVRGLRTVGVDRRVLRDVLGAGRTGAAVTVLDGSPGPRRYGIGSAGGLPSAWAAPPVLLAEMELRGVAFPEPRVIAPPVYVAR